MMDRLIDIQKLKHRRSYNEGIIKPFNNRLLSIKWDEIKNCDDANEVYKQSF